MRRANDGRIKVGVHPLLILNIKVENQSLDERSNKIEGG